MKDMIKCAFRSLEEKCLWSHNPQCSHTSQKRQGAFENELLGDHLLRAVAEMSRQEGN